MKRPSIAVGQVGEGPSPPADRIEAAAAAALGTGAAPLTELSVTLVPVTYMRDLNRDYHGVDAETDVLAFALGGEGSLVGDVYVCTEVAAGSAHELGIELEEEVLRLVIHGVLHILGHEHPEGPDRAESDMFALQERLLAEVLAGP